MLLLYSASAALVIVLVLWRSLEPRGLVLITGAVSAVALVGLFPLLPTARPHHPRPIQARFREPLTGQILVERGVSKSVISMAGTGRGRQNVLVRADLLAGFQRLESTSLQLEYLPSGTICRGLVTHVQSFGFSGSCRLPGGARRSVSASWRLVSENNLRGTIESSPVAA
jgi:hypothetical protein